MDYQHNFKKKFGQNFLNDENILTESQESTFGDKWVQDPFEEN